MSHIFDTYPIYSVIDPYMWVNEWVIDTRAQSFFRREYGIVFDIDHTGIHCTFQEDRTKMLEESK